MQGIGSAIHCNPCHVLIIIIFISKYSSLPFLTLSWEKDFLFLFLFAKLMEKNSISKLEIIQTRITNDNNNKTSEEKLLLIPLITEANNSCL